MKKNNRKHKKNLMILGASGNVANALLHSLVHHRDFFGKLVLLDKNKKVLSDPYIDHKALKYSFIEHEIELPKKEKELISILKRNEIDIALDITADVNTVLILEACNKAKVSCVNTGMNSNKYNDEESTIANLIFNLFRVRKRFSNAVHIMCTGMNPGVVNMWVRHGIEKFGVPKEIVHFEYDTSKVARGWRPMMTWSLPEFLSETVEDTTGVLLGRYKLKEIFPNALENKVMMTSILKPIIKFEKYPHGFLMVHEECVSIAQKYNIPSKFLYAINMQTAEVLTKLYEKKGKVTTKDIILGDNTSCILDGSDNIGVILEYKDKKVYYFNTMPNVAIIATNATLTQVIIGIFASLFTLVFDDLKKGIYFVEDLYDTHYKYYLFDNMRIQEFVFKKQKGKWKLTHYIPEIKIRREDHFGYMYI